jgi:predicted nucleic acid-binding protein
VRTSIAQLERSGKALLIDTNILSATMKSQVDRRLEVLFSAVPDERFRISVITLGELEKGLNLLRSDSDKERRRTLRNKIDALQQIWSDRVLDVDAKVARKWGELQARYQSVGKPLPAVDAIIAATACVHDLVLVSHDAVFERLEGEVQVYDPLDATAQREPI